ncbi:PhzF family phenazine biosynthesis protein [Cyanobium sp. LEGE 06113]|uniref:PhzF family phenazine biosynthesis protein n=1 Tax=Cyanobium sp. LEGE 06113 TaxID=1297573 RepID=UPI00187F3D23|nr:PhzF family phenazine biosynthesis protein [Cyanobium sp. LEGE 06113]MBE9153486.1 PhzF family phenazine biosynthesis protein [Cyanobium sp. LEGE 06113]
MKLPAVLVEAFASGPCSGNGAAVVLVNQPLPDSCLQGLARSLNQSETAFLWRQQQEWQLRWFTPTCEVPLCGHATLAALLALGHWGLVAPGSTLRFHSLSGPLEARLLTSPATTRDGLAAGWIVLPSSGLVPAPLPQELGNLVSTWLACGVEGHWTSPLGYTVLLLPASAPLASAVLPASAIPPGQRPGLVLMQPLAAEGPAAPAVLNETCRYQLRFLAPGLGIDEDPVTGSAHALVAPWWLQQLELPRVAGWQCSPRPGGMVCEAAFSGMIRLSGSGHLLWDGHVHLGSGDDFPGRLG